MEAFLFTTGRRDMVELVGMRPSLLKDPKVLRMARYLSQDQQFVRHVLPGFEGQSTDVQISVDALVRIVVGGLLQVWSAVGSISSDGLVQGASILDLDYMSGLPSFGKAMQLVGWAQETADHLMLPNFGEYNLNCKPATRANQKQYQVGPKQASLFDSDEEYTEDFEEFWQAYPKKVGKGAAYKAWRRIRPSVEKRKQILDAVNVQKRSMDWIKQNGTFIPHASTWLNGSRWCDSVDACTSPITAEERILRTNAQAQARREESERIRKDAQKVRDLISQIARKTEISGNSNEN